MTARSDYARALGARLRTIRTQQGLSLAGVEEKSQGRWKAVVIGTYERGDRAVTVQRLTELAEFYGVPVQALLPDCEPPAPDGPSSRLVIDLPALRDAPTEAELLRRYVSAIRAQRNDYGGRALSLRGDDLRALAVIYDLPPAVLVEQLTAWGVLRDGAR